MTRKKHEDDPEQQHTRKKGEKAHEASPPGDARPPAAEEPSLEQQLAQARRALEEAHQKHLYAVADLQNYKRRMTQELADRMEFANEQLLRDLLPLLDNFRLALQSIPANTDTQGVLAGVRMILQQFEDLMHSYGVEQVIAAPGTEFDAAVHEAVERVEAGPELQGKVVEEVARGYTFRNRLLRPAKVKAGAMAAEQAAAEDPT